jgi:hypothetical protein
MGQLPLSISWYLEALPHVFLKLLGILPSWCVSGKLLLSNADSCSERPNFKQDPEGSSVLPLVSWPRWWAWLIEWVLIFRGPEKGRDSEAEMDGARESTAMKCNGEMVANWLRKGMRCYVGVPTHLKAIRYVQFSLATLLQLSCQWQELHSCYTSFTSPAYLRIQLLPPSCNDGVTDFGRPMTKWG